MVFYLSNSSNMESCLSYMEARVTNDMNSQLPFDFIELEVKESIFQMPSLSSPVHYGFLAHFYQTNWASIGENVCKFGLKFLKQGGSPKSVDEISITLV